MMDFFHFGWRLTSVTWSLYPEMLFSAILPLYFLLTGKSWKSAAVFYLILAVFSWAVRPTGPSDSVFVLLRFFFLGIVLQHFVAFMRTFGIGRLAMISLYGAFLVGCIFSLAFSSMGDAAMQSGEMPMILAMYRRIGLSFHQDLCIWLLVLPILLCPLLRKIFSSPPLVFLGVISYGIYILHMPLVYLLHGATYAPLTGTISVDFSAPIAALGAQGLPVYWLAVIALATLCHLLIERPMIRFGHTVGQRIEAAASGDGLAQKG